MVCLLYMAFLLLAWLYYVFFTWYLCHFLPDHRVHKFLLFFLPHFGMASFGSLTFLWCCLWTAVCGLRCFLGFLLTQKCSPIALMTFWSACKYSPDVIVVLHVCFEFHMMTLPVFVTCMVQQNPPWLLWGYALQIIDMLPPGNCCGSDMMTSWFAECSSSCKRLWMSQTWSFYLHLKQFSLEVSILQKLSLFICTRLSAEKLFTFFTMGNLLW